MNERDQHDTLDLEEIIKEFGSGAAASPVPPDLIPGPKDKEPARQEPEEGGPLDAGEAAPELPSFEALNFSARTGEKKQGAESALLPLELPQEAPEEEPVAGPEEEAWEEPAEEPLAEPEEGPEESPEEEPEAPPAAAEDNRDTRQMPPLAVGSTIRLDFLDEIPEQEDSAEPDSEADTIRLDREEVTHNLEPETEAEEAAPEEPKEAEFEDEDEEEITLPPRIILFRPRTRLRELKKELISGPEKRYYELSEQGVGKLQMAIFLSIIVVLISGGAALMYNQGMVPESRLKLMIFSQILAMLVGALLGSQQLVDGFFDLFRGRFTPNTLLCFTFGACALDGLVCLKQQRVPLCAAFTLEVAMALLCSYQKRCTETGVMDTLRKANRLSALVRREEYYDGRPAFLRTDGKVADFMEHYGQVTGPEKKQNVYAFLCLLMSIGAGVAGWLLHSRSTGLLVLSTTLLVSFPASFFVSISRPMAVLERKLHALGTVLCGWQGIKGLAGRAVFPLEDEDLFPVGAAKLNGVKFYEHHDPDQVIAYAAALMRANGGCLAPTFDQLLTSRNGIRYTAGNIHFYGNGGIGGQVNGENVLMGELDFLKDMGVEIPEGVQVRQAVYVAVDGDLAGLFAINYSRMKYSVSGLATLAGYTKLKTLILASDFMITAPFLKEKFGVSIRRMVFPKREEQAQLAAQTPPEDAVALALTTVDGLAPAAYAVTGARALRKAWTMGLIVHIIGGLLGVLIMLALAYLGSTHLLTPVHILLYQLVWMIPGWLVTLWPRAV